MSHADGIEGVENREDALLLPLMPLVDSPG